MMSPDCGAVEKSAAESVIVDPTAVIAFAANPRTARAPGGVAPVLRRRSRDTAYP
jgi:hypothetical protein